MFFFLNRQLCFFFLKENHQKTRRFFVFFQTKNPNETPSAFWTPRRSREPLDLQGRRLEAFRTRRGGETGDGPPVWGGESGAKRGGKTMEKTGKNTPFYRKPWKKTHGKEAFCRRKDLYLYKYTEKRL